MTIESKGRYPLSTSDGQSIPFDVLRPGVALFAPFVVGAPSPQFTLDPDAVIFSLSSSVDCLLCFPAGTNLAAIPAPFASSFTEDSLYIPKNTVVMMSPPIDSSTLALKRIASVIGINSSGTLIVQSLKAWTGLATASQLIRR